MQSPIVVVLAAGLGTRMKSETAKVLHHVAGKPMVTWPVDAALSAAARKVVVVLGHQRAEVDEVLAARYDGRVLSALQAQQNGTGHALACALPMLAGEADEQVVVVLSGDAPLFPAARIKQLVEACARATSGLALVATRAPRAMPYGRLIRDEGGKLQRIVEERDATAEEKNVDELNAGFYAIRLGDLRRDIGELGADNAQGEVYLPDLVAIAARRGAVEVLDAPWEDVSGINDRYDLAKVEAVARERINAAWMRAGVSMEDPRATFIDAEVAHIGRDVWLAAGVRLRGATSIGDGVRIDAGSILTDVSVASGARIKPYSVLSESTLGMNVQVGPFSHCRPGSVLDEDARVGNFVETKKAHLMAGAKANHLAYLGDASVGSKANIGAGTITCNYDGFSKHKTVIEAGAFIGSNSELVAPVTVGRNAYVGSGTTVTKDVPRSALALSRVKQVNKDDWADRFRDVQRKRRARKGD